MHCTMAVTRCLGSLKTRRTWLCCWSPRSARFKVLASGGRHACLPLASSCHTRGFLELVRQWKQESIPSAAAEDLRTFASFRCQFTHPSCNRQGPAGPSAHRPFAQHCAGIWARTKYVRAGSFHGDSLATSLFNEPVHPVEPSAAVMSPLQRRPVPP